MIFFSSSHFSVLSDTKEMLTIIKIQQVAAETFDVHSKGGKHDVPPKRPRLDKNRDKRFHLQLFVALPTFCMECFLAQMYRDLQDAQIYMQMFNV